MKQLSHLTILKEVITAFTEEFTDGVKSTLTIMLMANVILDPLFIIIGGVSKFGFNNPDGFLLTWILFVGINTVLVSSGLVISYVHGMVEAFYALRCYW